ncbi:hypothetical protein MLD38_016274 [Melastoma candidum]|uniref:Uncharacterized protein n=1 Tax=Melastoma candidum TaxID=119954 RepID=A0ACB9RJ23_9MYRT|nr:hypothetical protein MLD38_016274 [Melastoma candidum]
MAANVGNGRKGPRDAAEAAVRSIGLGYDFALDLRLKYCKRFPIINLSANDDGGGGGGGVHDIRLPGTGFVVTDVPSSIKCDKGDRVRFSSDVLTFQQMSEQFNQVAGVSGKIPSGHFNSAFDFRQGWQRDAAGTKTLAFDGVFITLYSIELKKSQFVLAEHVRQAVPSSWDPAALARFIEKYGTHVIVGVKVGGKDVVYAKQQHSSLLQPNDVQTKLKDMADSLFVHGTSHSTAYSRRLDNMDHGLNFVETIGASSYNRLEIQDIVLDCKRKGGSNKRNLSHSEWSQTVAQEPDVVSMTFVPIASMLSGIDGSGFLSHAINLYLRYKPPAEDLHQFLEFQLPRQWAPVFGELSLGPQKKQQSSTSLQFSFMGPKLYVNTTPVDVGKKPVTGLRLYLEGKRGNHLAIHLQHLSSLPKTFQLAGESDGNSASSSVDRGYYEKVQWKSFSHICAAPVESEDDLSIVTGAHFEVADSGIKKVLFLRLSFSRVVGATIFRKAEWEGSPGLAQKSGIISTLISTRFSSSQKPPPPKPSDVNINSAVYPGGPPVPAQTTKLLKFVDTTEITRGPQDSPGYWVVSGARLQAEGGKISLQVKYSLLNVVLPDEELPLDV